jgi:cytochrome b6-f complex iron-sulfur subunit
LSSWTILGLAVAGGVAIVAALVIAIGARRRPTPSAKAAGATAMPVSAETASQAVLSRRQLINRGIIGVFTAALAGVVTSAVAYIWPEVDSGSGSKYAVGGASDLKERLAVDRRPYVGGNGRFYLVPFPTDRLAEARKVYPAPVIAGMKEGLVALSPVCTHEGCHVPYCDSSAWFECPCHGSRYDGIGEQRRGPAPRGLDHYAVTVVGGVVTVDTTRRYLGPPPGTETIDDPAAGPHCY